MAGIHLNTAWLKTLWRRRFVRILTITAAVLILLWTFRLPILRGMGNYLVADDPLAPCHAYFILGGNSFERGNSAAEIWRVYPDAWFVASGGNYPLQIQALDTVMTEASLTRHWMIRQGVPANRIDTISRSTSTMEESKEILQYCLDRQYNNITLVSSTFHLRRMRMVFEDEFARHGITTRYHGAAAAEFRTTEWWRDELSLITLNNEYVKIIYYKMKY